MTTEYKQAEGRRVKVAFRKMRNEAPREPTEAEIAAAVAETPDYLICTISKKHFDNQFCKCLRYREAGKCDCKLCE